MICFESLKKVQPTFLSKKKPDYSVNQPLWDCRKKGIIFYADDDDDDKKVDDNNNSN